MGGQGDDDQTMLREKLQTLKGQKNTMAYFIWYNSKLSYTLSLIIKYSIILD